MEDDLSLREAADILELDQRTLKKRIQKGELNAKVLSGPGGNVYYQISHAEIERYKESMGPNGQVIKRTPHIIKSSEADSCEVEKVEPIESRKIGEVVHLPNTVSMDQLTEMIHSVFNRLPIESVRAELATVGVHLQYIEKHYSQAIQVVQQSQIEIDELKNEVKRITEINQKLTKSIEYQEKQSGLTVKLQGDMLRELRVLSGHLERKERRKWWKIFSFK